MASADERKLVSFGSEWRYSDTGEDLGTTWRTPEFDYSSWPISKAKLGFGGADIKTKLSYGDNPDKKRITYYFRRYFDLDSIPKDNELTLRIRHTDGYAIYLNGKPFRSANLPPDPKFDTPATASHEANVTELSEGLSTGILLKGKNFLAVEIHLAKPSAPELGFDLELAMSPISDRLRIKPKVEAAPIKEWLVSDAFANNDESLRLKKDYLAGEDKALPDPSLTLGGCAWTVRSTESGLLDFEGMAGLRAKTNASIYAHVYVNSPIDQGAILYMGSDDGCAAWLNGTRVHFNDVYRGFVADKDEIPVHLVAGWNRLLTKASQGTGRWDLQTRLARIDGKPIEGLTYSVKNPLTEAQWQGQRRAQRMDVMPGKTMAYVNNGRLTLWFGQSQDSLLNILLDGRKAGSLRAAVAQCEKPGIGYKKTGVGWSEAAAVTDIRLDTKDPNTCVADVTVERNDSAETQRKYQAKYRFTIRLGEAWFESRLISLKNTDSVEYETRGYWHMLQPPISDAEPHCYNWVAVWVSEAGGVGAVARDEDDFVLALRSADGRPYGDLTRKLTRKLAPGFETSVEEPGLILFATEKRKPDDAAREGAKIRMAQNAGGEKPSP